MSIMTPTLIHLILVHLRRSRCDYPIGLPRKLRVVRESHRQDCTDVALERGPPTHEYASTTADAVYFAKLVVLVALPSKGQAASLVIGHNFSWKDNLISTSLDDLRN